MASGTTLIVHRGPEIPLEEIHAASREVLGGHLRPDADLVVHRSAMIRVGSGKPPSDDPLLDTVRAIHLAVPRGQDEILTSLSPLVLRARMGFPEEWAEEGWEHFAHAPAAAVALALSERTGPIAVLFLDDGSETHASYSIFSGGRRLWSASYNPVTSYVTWDGNELVVEPMEGSDPSPMEGPPGSFPAHGLKLLFSDPIELTHAEVQTLLPAMWRASRPPLPEASGMWLVEGGRFVPPGRSLTEEDWERFVGSFVA